MKLDPLTTSIAVLISLSVTAKAQNVFPPVADALVRGGTNSGFNYGADQEIAVKKDKYLDQRRESYLRFDLKDRLASLSSNAKVKLRLVIKSVAQGEMPGNFNLILRPVSDTLWMEGTGTAGNPSENGINFKNKPVMGVDTLGALPGKAAESIIDFDVTRYVMPLLKAGKRVFSFNLSGSVHLVDGTTNGFFAVYARENARKSPQLIIE